MRAFGIQAAKRRGDREVNNLPGFVSVDRVRPGGMSRKGRMAIQYQVSDSVHRFIYPPDTSSSRVEGMEGPSNSKIPVSIRSNLLGQARARGIEPFVRCLNRIAARNAKDSFFFLSFFLFLWLLRESFQSPVDLISILTIRLRLVRVLLFEIKRETILTLFSEICIRPRGWPLFVIPSRCVRILHPTS